MRLPDRSKLPKLTEVEGRVLDSVVSHQFDSLEGVLEGVLLLDYPDSLWESVRKALSRLDVEDLVRTSQDGRYTITAAGLVCAPRHSGPVMGWLEKLLAFFQKSLNEERGGFRQYTTVDLALAHIHPDDFKGVSVVISEFNLASGSTLGSSPDNPKVFRGAWTVPSLNDFVELKRASTWQDVYDLRVRQSKMEAWREAQAQAARSADRESGGGTQVMGDQHNHTTLNITAQNVAGLAVGSGTATGTVTTSTTVTPEEATEAIQRARGSLAEDDRLGQLEEGLYDSLHQVLRLLAKVQVQQGETAVVAKQLKDAVDDLWVAEVAPKLKGGTLPEGLEVTKALLSSPVLAAAVRLLGGAP